MFKVLIIPHYMSILLCTSCQAADGSNLFASCNRFQSVDQFGICDAMWILALADVHGDSDYVHKECRVLQGRDVKALSEQRQSNMQVELYSMWHLRTDRMHILSSLSHPLLIQIEQRKHFGPPRVQQ